MRALAISDLHYELRIREGVDESMAWDWLLSVVDEQSPDVLLSCGDWGEAVTADLLRELTERVEVYTVYGNHENLAALESARNRRGTPVLLGDCEIVDVGGVRIAGINGVVAPAGGSRGVPRKTPDEYLRAAYCLAGRGVDILLLHEVVPLPEYGERVRRDYLWAVAEALEIVSPRVALNGHLHTSRPFTVSRLGAVLYLRVDSSQAFRHYAVIDWERGRVEVWRDLELVWKGEL